MDSWHCCCCCGLPAALLLLLLLLQVTSGQMAALGLPIAGMNLDAEKLIDTYGKTW